MNNKNMFSPSKNPLHFTESLFLTYFLSLYVFKVDKIKHKRNRIAPYPKDSRYKHKLEF